MKLNLKSEKNQVAMLVAVVYFIQGALGISAIAVPVFFRRLGWSISEITIISSIASLPWVLKVFYGFLSDGFPILGLRRKPYLFFYLICSILGWLSLSRVAGDKTSILISLLVANLGFAGTDVITDGLIVEHSEKEWGPIYQSIAWGFRSLGSVLSGMLGGWFMLHFNPPTLFLITACLPLLGLPILCYLHETKNFKATLSTHLAFQLEKIKFFCLSSKIQIFVLFLFLSTSSALFGTPFFFFLKEKLFFQDDFLGFLISLGWVGAAIGSIAYGLWLKKTSEKKLFYAVVILNTLNILSTYCVWGVYSAAFLTFVGGIAAGMMILPLMTGVAVMTSGSGVEGTLFALLMGFYNLSQIAWGILGGKIFPHTGLWFLVGVAALIQFLGYFLVSRMDFAQIDPFKKKSEIPSQIE